MKVENGLENVIAAETALSHVDGAAGELIIRGHSLDTLASTFTYEEVVSLLLHDQFEDMPSNPQQALAEARTVVFDAAQPIDQRIVCLPLYDGVRALMATLKDSHTMDDALRLIAAPAVFTPALIRLKAGKQTMAPDADLPHAKDILRMMGNNKASTSAHGLDRYLITVVDHGLNASTFAARVVASTQAGLSSSVLAALGALKGPLHGGAPGPVLDMLDAIGEPGLAGAWIAARLESGDRLMGFGHRIYKVRDPRADALKSALGQLKSSDGADTPRLIMAEQIERIALAALAAHKPRRSIKTNVEFYTALLLEALGFPQDAFTCVFAMGRVTGWVAHAREQARTGRLIRPQSRYTGPMPQRAA